MTKHIETPRPVFENYQGWANWDTWETNLIMQNDEQLYRNLQAWKANWQKKRRSGRFDREKAKYAIAQYIVREARRQDPEINPFKVDYDGLLDHWLGEIDEELGHGVYGSRVY
jgi:hypothetical protein